MSYQIRKWVSAVEEIRHETGPPTAEPLVKAAAGLVLRNPFAGQPTHSARSSAGTFRPWLAP